MSTVFSLEYVVDSWYMSGYPLDIPSNLQIYGNSHIIIAKWFLFNAV